MVSLLLKELSFPIFIMFSFWFHLHFLSLIIMSDDFLRFTSRITEKMLSQLKLFDLSAVRTKCVLGPNNLIESCVSPIYVLSQKLSLTEDSIKICPAAYDRKE